MPEQTAAKPARKYTYLVGFQTPFGAFGSMRVSFSLPITSQDQGTITDLVQKQHPGAAVLGFSLFAPDRTKTQADRPAMASDLLTVIADLRKAVARIDELEEQVKALRREAGPLP